MPAPPIQLSLPIPVPIDSPRQNLLQNTPHFLRDRVEGLPQLRQFQEDVQRTVHAVYGDAPPIDALKITHHIQSPTSERVKDIYFSPEIDEPIHEAHALSVFLYLYGEQGSFDNFEIEGSLERGLLIYSRTDSDQYVRVTSGSFRPRPRHEWTKDTAGRDVVTVQGQHGIDHIEFPMFARSQRQKDLARADIIALVQRSQNPTPLHSDFEHDKTVTDPSHRLLKGSGLMGGEIELWAHENPITSTGHLIDHDGGEFARGQDEYDEGIHVSPVMASKSMGEQRLAAIARVQKKFPNALYLAVGSPMIGSVAHMKTNIDPNSNVGVYMEMMDHRQWEVFIPKSPYSVQIRDQQVKNNVYTTADGDLIRFKDFTEFKNFMNNTAYWCCNSAQWNIGLPNTFDPKTGTYVVDKLMVRNASRISTSDLSAFARFASMSGPYLTGIIPKVKIVGTDDVVITYSMREFFRNDFGTAWAHNRPIGDSDHQLEILKKTTIGKNQQGSDRLERALVAHFVPTNGGPYNPENDPLLNDELDPIEDALEGDYIATAHGAARWRIAATGKASARIEITGFETSNILAKNRTMAFCQFMMEIAKAATAHDQDVLQYIYVRSGRDPEFHPTRMFGNADAFTQDMALLGPRSQIGQALQKKFSKLVTLFEKDFPAIDEQTQILKAMLDTTMRDNTLTELAQGRGTLGAAIRQLAIQNYSAEQAALIVHDFLLAEAEFLAKASAQERLAYLSALPDAGFNFVIPKKRNIRTT